MLFLIERAIRHVLMRDPGARSATARTDKASLASAGYPGQSRPSWAGISPGCHTSDGSALYL